MSLGMRQTALSVGPKIYVNGIKQNISRPWLVQVEMLKVNTQVLLSELQKLRTRNNLRTRTVLKGFTEFRWIILTF